MPNPFRATLDSLIIKTLTSEADRVAERAKANAGWSSKIPEAISVTEAKKAGDRFEISIIIDSSEDGPAPHAAAFEYGSGEHATRGKVGEYPIPKKPTGVKFPKERWPKYIPPPPVPDFFFFTQIMHPGVEPRPYIAPSIEESKQKIREILGRNFKASILVGVPKVEVISARK